MNNKKRGLLVCISVLVVLILLEVFFVHHHVHYFWHGMIGFDVLYGVLGCFILIAIPKGLGKLFIQRDENYYRGGEDRHA